MNLPQNGMIAEKIRAGILSQREEWPVRSNRASEMGHPCVRYLYYMRTAWNQRPLPDVGLLEIFEEGKVQERNTEEMLRRFGLQLNQQQRAIDLAHYEISGSIDGNTVPININEWPDWPLEDNGKPMWVPTEIKSMSPWIWDSINSYEDIIASDKHWIKKYPGQLQIYLLGIEKPVGLLILKNKTTYRIKDIWVPLDYDLANQMLDKASAVNKAIAKDAAPDRLETGYCRECPFNVICQPLITTGTGAEIFENPELEELLEIRDQNAEASKLYNQADKKVKDMIKELPEVFICGDWFVEGKLVQKKEFTVAASSYMKRTISRLQGGDE